MLGIDFTLLSLHLSSSEAENLCSVAIEFRDLQTAYISINKKKTSLGYPAPRNPTKSESRSCLGGLFAIIERNEQFLDDVVNSTVSISATVLANGDRSALFSYARGSNDRILQDRGIMESYINKSHESVSRAEDDPNFMQKLSVFGEASIMAYFQSVTIELIHSFGVSSIAGSVTFSIAIIDLSKATREEATVSTESVRQDLPRNLPQKPVEITFDMDGFLNQGNQHRNIGKISAGHIREQPAKEPTRITPNLEASDGVADEHSDYNSDFDSGSSVSVDDFFARISGRGAVSTEPAKVAAIEIIDSKDTIDDDHSQSIPKDTPSFRYPVVDKGKPKMRVVPQGMRRTPAIVGYALDRPPPSAQTQSGVRVRGSATKKKVVKEWDSAPMTRQDYSKEATLIKRENPKLPIKPKNGQKESVQKESVIAGDTLQGNSASTSISTSTSTSTTASSSSRCDSIDRKLLFSSYQNVQISAVNVVRGAKMNIDMECKKEKSKISPPNTDIVNTVIVCEEIGGHREEDLNNMNDIDEDAEIAITAAPEATESEAASHPHDISCLSNTS